MKNIDGNLQPLFKKTNASPVWAARGSLPESAGWGAVPKVQGLSAQSLARQTRLNIDGESKGSRRGASEKLQSSEAPKDT